MRTSVLAASQSTSLNATTNHEGNRHQRKCQKRRQHGHHCRQVLFDSLRCKVYINCANHTLKSLSTYTFPLFFEEWDLPKSEVATAWDNKGDIVIGNDVRIGYDAVIMAGVRIGNGAIIGTRAVVSKDVEPYSIVGGVPAKEIRKRFAPEVIKKLMEIRWWNWPIEKFH